MASIEKSDFQLGRLLQGIVPMEGVNRSGTNIEVKGLASNSRLVKAGDLFIACRGEQQSRVAYIEQAVRSGACAVLAEADVAAQVSDCQVPLLVGDGLASKVGPLAARFYAYPSTQQTVIGVTGTNGKTSVGYLLAQAFSVNAKSGLIGTLGYGIFGDLKNSANTTLGAIELQKVLAELLAKGANTVVMEVSAHGIDQYRINGTEFNVGIFTNLSRDHLDYFHDMDGYAASKRRFFTDYSMDHLVVNLDDPFGCELIDLVSDKNIKILGYSLGISEYTDFPVLTAEVHTKNGGAICLDIRSPWGDGRLQSELLGEFNAANLLASVGALCLLGIPFSDALLRISACEGIPGRMQQVSGENTPLVIIDYAHTPDALHKVILATREHCQGKLYCVFGCGGDRDRGKRSEMGTAVSHADHVILTTDNPRYEDPQQIMADILAEVAEDDRYIVKVDRKDAIYHAIQQAQLGDVVVIAGKGHEGYQETAGVRYPFNDRLFAMDAIKDGRWE